MKNQNKYSIGLAAIAMLLATSSCEGFLDKMPDNRTELDNSEKVLQLLVSAYPSGTITSKILHNTYGTNTIKQ